MSLKTLIDNNKKKVKKVAKLADRVMDLADYYAQMSDQELQQQTYIFQDRLANGETLDDIMIEAFAVAREADKRVLGMFPYKVQIMGGIVIHQGNLAEMRTGEGKTLTETMPVYLDALSGEGVHVITVNEYLSQRDAEEMGQVFEWLGLTVGVNGEKLSPHEKKQAYNADITYSTNDQLAFDYLRDNMVLYKSDEVQRGLNFAIIDEVDSILIDECRTPLIISGEAESYKNLYKNCDKYAKTLNKDDYNYDKESKTISLTESGVEKANKFFGIHNLYGPTNFTLAHYVEEAIKAVFTMHRDKDYVVQNGEVEIVDTFTGRVMEGRRFSDGLHQALEAKEGVEIKDANRTEASITYQNFFRMYKKIAGMSGTASTEAKEFRETYHMDVVTIPTNNPVQRIDEPDLVFATKRAKFLASAKMIKKVHATGQPILVGTGSVDDSEILSHYLDKYHLPHFVLNAKNDSKEAQIVKEAGQIGAITIATNMAGRGTDIKLPKRAKELGGLFVLGTEKFESERIDNQLRGRAGRQGDPGVTQFFLSLDDEIIQRFGWSNKAKKLQKSWIKGDEYEAMQSKYLNHLIRDSQKRVEGDSYDERKNTLRYDDVLRQQREKIYAERQRTIDYDRPLDDVILAMFARTINRNVDKYYNKQEKNMEGIYQFMGDVLGISGYDERLAVKDMSRKDLKEYLFEQAEYELQRKTEALVHQEQLQEFEKVIILRAVDTGWKNQIDNLEQLRSSITLRGYGQYNPVVEYQKTASVMYDDMLADVEKSITRMFMRAEVREAPEDEEEE
ncbi:MAG: preprotein translocase subunit SecA [Lactobacillus crispatus]|nr:preprotein translocase subunit SecA [Lactobacillus crispatus]